MLKKKNKYILVRAVFIEFKYWFGKSGRYPDRMMNKISVEHQYAAEKTS